MRGARSVWEGEPFKTEVWVETMDRKRLSGEPSLLSFRDYLAAKYRGRRFDVVLASDDDAIRFAQRFGKDLWGDTPVVFCGLNDWPLAAELPRARFTGVLEDFETGAILNLALKFHPDSRRIWVVSDNSAIGIEQHRDLAQLATGRRDLEFHFLDGAQLSLAEILAAMAQVRSDDLVILTAFVRDRTGEYLDRAEAERRIVQASAGPVYSPSISSLGQGIVGANDNAGFDHGAMAGQKVVQVLKAVPPEQIAIERHARAAYVFDFNELRKYGIDAGMLPPDRRIINQPASFYSENRTAIWSALAALLMQTAVIVFLSVNIRRRRAAETALAGQAQALSSANRDLQTEIEQRRKAEHRAETIQEQFWQSQKMEAVGRLAGGIAHDFNNLLTVITGYGQLILENTEPQALRERVGQILKASDRAASLTSQLLAFSRKNLIQPKAISLNDVVRDTAGMIQRIIGDDIRLTTHLADPLPAVMADAGQISQVLLNLATNARDAMPAGGKLHIDTASVMLDIADAARYADVPPGQYVQLAVSDTGCGMDEETRRRSFEPFFTTKATGKGTGLGLSTAYGIVKQAGGHLWIDSEPGHGTTMKIHLPAVEGPVEPETGLEAETGDWRGTETVLVVEDQDEVRVFVASVLTAHGYHIVTAANGVEALRRLEDEDMQPHLLLTDVVMPDMNGRALAAETQRRLPQIRVLYTSGYAETFIVSQGVVEPGLVYLAKPFTPAELLRRVRDALA